MMHAKQIVLIIFLVSAHDVSSMKLSPIISNDIIAYHIMPRLSLTSINRLLRTCKSYLSLYNHCLETNQNTLLEQEKSAHQNNKPLCLDTFLYKNPLICLSISQTQHANFLSHYAQNNDTAMLNHIISHESDINKRRRIDLLLFLEYITQNDLLSNNTNILNQLSNLNTNTQAYKGLSAKTNAFDKNMFFSISRSPIIDEYILRIFINNQANPLRDSTGKSILHLAVAAGNNTCVSTLLKINKHLIDIQDNDGNTALHIATKHGNKIMAETLLGNNADVTIKNKKNQTAFDIAEHKENYALAYLLNGNQKVEIMMQPPSFCILL